MKHFEIEEFRWPVGIAEKVLIKHELFPEEVEDSFFHREAKVRRKGDRYILLTRTIGGGHYIIVIFAYTRGIATIITARFMTDSERRLFRRK
jgi:uncharacterized DUF497 family protein